jgi:hypothetical protein
MKRLIAISILLLCPATLFEQAIVVKHKAAAVNWTLVQTKSNYGCYGTTCSVSATVTAGNLLIMVVSSPAAIVTVYSSASGDSAWTHPATCYAISGDNGGQYQITDCVYVLAAAGGASTFTYNWTLSADSWDLVLYEVHRSTGTAAYDTSNANFSNACKSCVGPALTLSGSNDYIAQWISYTLPGINALSSPWTSPNLYDGGNVYGRFAGALNQTSGSAVTWGVSGSYQYAAMSAIAFK